MPLRHLEVVEKHEKTTGTLAFLRTELQTARTFIVIAQHAEYENKILRNIANALKACESTRYFMERVELSEEEAVEIGGKLARVENELAELEQSFRNQSEAAD